MKTKITGRKARLARENMAPALAATISDFHFFNDAVVSATQKKFDRIALTWPDGVQLWFDSEAVKLTDE